MTQPFSVPVIKIHDVLLVVLPREISDTLPSRGQVMTRGKLNNAQFQQALEPDGKGSHWIEITKQLQDELHLQAGDLITVELESVKQWPEPDIPEDILKAVTRDAHLQNLWGDVTPMARWEWIRWIQGTQNPDTRKKRIDVSVSKLLKGMRRPCCFNRASCTDPRVSKSGLLLEPTNYHVS